MRGGSAACHPPALPTSPSPADDGTPGPTAPTGPTGRGQAGRVRRDTLPPRGTPVLVRPSASEVPTRLFGVRPRAPTLPARGT